VLAMKPITDLVRIGVPKVIAKSSADVFKGSRKPLREHWTSARG
jgi:hypothetical protein